MGKFQLTLFAALILGLPGTQTATAQQKAVNISIVSGSGQVTCPGCIPPRNPLIQPLVVKVTDANGAPVPNQDVEWSIYEGGASLVFLRDSITTTDANGITQNRAIEQPVIGTLSSGFIQTNIIAALPSNGNQVVFPQTQAFVDKNNRTYAYVNAEQKSPEFGDPPLQGASGTTGSAPIKVSVFDAWGTPISGANIRLLQERADDTGKISCATGPGADPGSVLTDANGKATCYPVFSGSGPGSFNVLVGGVLSDDLFALNGEPIGYREFSTVAFNVTPAVPGSLQIVSGNNQSVTQGQAGQTLTVKLMDQAGTSALSGQQITWTVTPSGAATLSSTSASTDANGQASTGFTLSSTAIGAVQIKAALTSNTKISATFSITAVSNVTVSGLTKVSGDQQTTVAGQAFGQPLLVQVNGSNGQPVANYPVSFAISGPGTLSSTSAITDNSGRAQVTVNGTSQGSITVTATAGVATASFSLTVVPPGPNLTTSSFVSAADQQRGSVSPCSLVSIVGTGIAPSIQGAVLPSGPIGPLPTTLAGVSVAFSGIAAPIAHVSNVNGVQQVTVQVPCEVAPGTSIPVTLNANGAKASVNIPVQGAGPGVYLTTMSDGVQRVAAVRPDGSFVTLENPARRGEVIRVFATGLGTSRPAATTNALPGADADSNVLGQVIVGVNNNGTRLVSARQSPNLIGVFEIAFQVPADAPVGNNVIFSIGVNAVSDTQTRFSAGTRIPIQ